jgi:glucose-1-phosphate cytidylyltransferase
MSESIPIAILAGGRGTRITNGDDALPKPLVGVGGRPILWHVMALYAEHGFRDFVVLTGWRHGDVEAAAVTFHEVITGDWHVRTLNTGEDTPTGGRVHAARALLGGGTFGLTYADGVADIDLQSELGFHRAHGHAATMTVVRPRSPWGKAHIAADGRVDGFTEKPRLESWINGGFMFMEPRALDVIGADDVLEQGPLEQLAAAGELHAFKHEGFWDCMDTFKDAQVLNDLCAQGRPPWLKHAVDEYNGHRTVEAQGAV